jgi:glycosyltransferase involved in cell wall biosynthesis
VTRLVLLTEIPAPFRIPLFNALAERLELRVVFLRRRQPGRRYELHGEELRFEWTVLPGLRIGGGLRWVVVNAGVGRALRGADVVLVGGWSQPAFWQAAWWALRRRRPLLVWVESTLRDARPGFPVGAKRMLARRAAALVVPGSASAEYVRSVVPEARVAIAPNAVDAKLFASRVGDRERLRAELGLRRPCVLYVGRLAPEKGVGLLLEAARGLEADVVLAGSGPEEARLRAAAPANVQFLGNVERDALPVWYAAADVLCLPSSSEAWGMTLNEGAAAGLPLVATEAVGASWDLIEDGRSGFRVPTGDEEALRGALQLLVGDEPFRKAAGARSRALGLRFTPEAWANAVAALAGAAPARGSSPARP